MKYFSLKMTAYALAGIILAAPAQAGGLFDSDDNGYSGSYNRQNLNVYCDRYPADDACDDEPQYKRKTYEKSYQGGRCAALIRAAGKRNLVTAFARNSARFAWRRETRAVHGNQYANWHNARNPQITCTRIGALKSCMARGTPCSY
jgi:hypothetical protein